MGSLGRTPHHRTRRRRPRGTLPPISTAARQWAPYPRKAAMNSNFDRTFRVLTVATAVAIALTAFAAHAQEATAEQRRACTPDAFRLCGSHIPNVAAITAC